MDVSYLDVPNREPSVTVDGMFGGCIVFVGMLRGHFVGGRNIKVPRELGTRS